MTFEEQTRQTIKNLENKQNLNAMERNLLRVLKGEYKPTERREYVGAKQQLRVVTDTAVFCNEEHVHAYDQLANLKARYRNDPNFHIISQHEQHGLHLEVYVTYTHTDNVDLMMNGGHYF